MRIGERDVTHAGSTGAVIELVHASGIDDAEPAEIPAISPSQAAKRRSGPHLKE